MKKFSFRLQNVLDVREREEEEKERLLGEANQRLQAAKQKLAHLELSRQKNDPYQDDDTYVHMAGLYLARLLHTIELAFERVTQCEAEVLSAREAYFLAHRTAESLRKLREKKIAEYNKALETSEEKFIDEISTLRYTRESKESH